MGGQSVCPVKSSNSCGSKVLLVYKLLLVGFDTQSEIGSAVGLQAPSASTMSRRHVLNLVNSLMPQPARFPMPAMFQVSNAVPSVMWPQYAASQPARPCHGSSSATGYTQPVTQIIAAIHGGKFPKSLMMASETWKVLITSEPEGKTAPWHC